MHASIPHLAMPERHPESKIFNILVMADAFSAAYRERQMTALGKSPCRLRVKTTLLYTCRNRPIPAVPDRLLISYIDPPNQMKNNLTLSLGLMDSVKHIQAGKAVYSRKVIAYE